MKHSARVLAIAAAITGITACTRSEKPPPQAGQPLDPLTTASRMVAMPIASALGDEDAAKAHFDAAHADLLRSMKVADSRRPIDREAARAAAREVPGVRAVAWVDRHHLLALVDGQGHRTQKTIDGICHRLEPLGDTLAVVVHLQDATARSGDELETISRNCQLKPGEVAFAQPRRQLDVVAPAIRTQHRAVNAAAPDAEESQRRADEAMRVLEDSTPSM